VKALLATVGRWLLTGATVIGAIALALLLWSQYETEPWTRDGHVRVDVVRVTSDVSGLVTGVAVHDNQPVHRGELLFVVDRPRYEHALREIDASIASAKAVLEQANRVSRRDLALAELVAAETREENEARVETARATVNQLLAARSTAQLNIERTSVYATVDGVVNNLDLHPGDYIAVGQQALAITDVDTLRVEAYMEETKLDRIAIGDQARIRLMGSTAELRGHVVSYSSGIADDQAANTANQLRQINPTFTWVRLAQRIPVRIHIDRMPLGTQLIAGRTATVVILPGTAQ
jgi:RND family efflux transporter MFP subunit